MSTASLNPWLLAAALLNAVASLLHVGCIVFGAPWYRFLGAGEAMATMAERGDIRPAVITALIASLLLVWAAYAASGAGLISRLPFMRAVLVLVTAIYAIRGIAGFALIANPLGRTPSFWIWSSLICLAIAAIHALGLVRLHQL